MPFTTEEEAGEEPFSTSEMEVTEEQQHIQTSEQVEVSHYVCYFNGVIWCP